jgi:tRNA/rRNA methyltransferase
MIMPQASFMQFSDQVRWVMVETSHAGNLGSAARALKTMGFHELHLVRPRTPDMPIQPDAIALASGAADILAATQMDTALAQSVRNCTVVLGLSSREREFGPPALPWNQGLNLLTDAIRDGHCVALVFGPERTGLENEDLAFCTHRVYLPANPQYPSLNLAQAMMVCTFGLRQALLENPSAQVPHEDFTDLADPNAVAAMLDHWQAGLEAIAYLDPNHPKKLMPRLQTLFARSRLRKEEIDLLRGIAKQMLLRK